MLLQPPTAVRTVRLRQSALFMLGLWLGSVYVREIEYHRTAGKSYADRGVSPEAVVAVAIGGAPIVAHVW